MDLRRLSAVRGRVGGACWDISPPPALILGALIPGYATKRDSALIRLANPSSVISRWVFLASPR